MDDLAANIIDREQALANFDHARNDFEAAFERVPDEALDWKPQGDDYSFGDLLPHIIESITRYTTALGYMKNAGAGAVGPGWEADQPMADYNARVQAIYAAGGGRTEIMDELDATHDRLAGLLREIAYDEYSRRTDVHYGDSSEPYPTSAHDIVGWLTDHYHEHIAHVGQMLEQWTKGMNDQF